MIEYVAGFLIDKDRMEVALVRKNRPAWQAGKFNGIGGKVEPGETALAAMEREFNEETGAWMLGGWKRFARLRGDDFLVHFFAWSIGLRLEGLVRTVTDEEIAVVPLSEITAENSIPNLTWLLPMALSLPAERASEFEVSEIM